MSNFKRHIKAAIKSSPTYKLESLLAEETKWGRKLTIAQNKLDDVRRRINKYAKGLIEVTVLQRKAKEAKDEADIAVNDMNNNHLPRGTTLVPFPGKA